MSIAAPKETKPLVTEAPKVIFTISSSSSLFSPQDTKESVMPAASSENKEISVFYLSDDDDDDQEVLTNGPAKPLNIQIKNEVIEESDELTTGTVETNKNTETLIAISDLTADKIDTEAKQSDESDDDSSTTSSNSSSSSMSSAKLSVSKINASNPLDFELSDDEYLENSQLKQDDNSNFIDSSMDMFDDLRKEPANINTEEELVMEFILEQEDHFLEDILTKEIDEFIFNSIVNQELKIKEEEKRLDELVEKLILTQLDACLEEMLTRAAVETNICDFIREKLINEEIRTQLKAVGLIVIDEEKKEMKLLEKKIHLEIKEALINEFVETIINDTLGSLMKECCERVILEVRNERINTVYNDLLDDLMPKLIEKELFEVIFNEMNPRKPLIPRISISPETEPVKHEVEVKTKLLPSSSKRNVSKPELKKPPAIAEKCKTPANLSHIEIEKELHESPLTKRFKLNETAPHDENISFAQCKTEFGKLRPSLDDSTLSQSSYLSQEKIRNCIYFTCLLIL